MNKYIVTFLMPLLMMNSCVINNNSSSSSSISTSSSSSYFNPYEYIKDSNIDSLKEKIENKEDFIYVISYKYCNWCQKQENDLFNYMYSAPATVYVHKLDEMFENLETNNNDEPLFGIDKYNAAKEEYRLLASFIEKVGDFILGENGPYIKENYTERFGVKEPSLVYPSTLLFNDGELVVEFSYIGYGWSETKESFQSFINVFNNIKNF